MAKGQKQKKQEELIISEIEQPLSDLTELVDPIDEKEVVITEEPPVIVEDQVATTSIEPEEDFLRRLLQIQEEGGWGKHLHPIIKERLKALGK